MTRDALAALDRRGFLKSAGALIVGFSMSRGEARAQFGNSPIPGSPPNGELDSWIAIATDGAITAYSGKEELGQGIATAQQQLVAEELSVPFERVNLIYCDTALTPDQAYTSGSQSHPANFNHANLALACATAREALLKTASERLHLPIDQLTASDGIVSARADASKKITYAQLVGGRKPPSRARQERQAQTPEGMDSSRQADRPYRYGRHGHRAIRICSQRPASRHAARVRGASSSCGRDAGRCGREFGQRHRGCSEDRGPQEFRWRGSAETVAGNTSRRRSLNSPGHPVLAFPNSRNFTIACGSSAHATLCWWTPKTLGRSSLKPQRSFTQDTITRTRCTARSAAPVQSRTCKATKRRFILLRRGSGTKRLRER